MHNSEARRRKERQKEQIKQRYNVVIDPENYEYIPAKKQADYYDNDVNQRVAIYVRVSTDDVRQTTSYELQKKYYEEFVTRHPNWTLVNIYADESAIIGLSQNPVQTGGDLALFFLFSAQFSANEGVPA